MLDDTQFFDSADTDQEAEGYEPEAADGDVPANDDETPDNEPERRGNPDVPLKHLRADVKRLTAELEASKQQQQQYQLMLEQMQQRGYSQPERNPADETAYRQQLAEAFLERPDEVFNQWGNTLEQRMQKQMFQAYGPMMVDRAFSDAAGDDPKLQAVAKSVKPILEAYVADSLQQGNYQGAVQGLGQLLPHFSQMLENHVAAAQPKPPKPAPDRASSFAGTRRGSSPAATPADLHATLLGMTGRQRIEHLRKMGG